MGWQVQSYGFKFTHKHTPSCGKWWVLCSRHHRGQTREKQTMNRVGEKKKTGLSMCLRIFLYKHKSLYCVSEYVSTYRPLTVTQTVNQNISVRTICNFFRSALHTLLNEVPFYYYACLIINSHRCTHVRICVYVQAWRVFNFCETLVRRLVDKISQLNLVHTLLVVSSFWVLF
jgi:hypothetical protein